MSLEESIIVNDSQSINLKILPQLLNIKQILKDSRKNINLEVEDMEEMIENLKTEFKSKNQMKFKEEQKEINSISFLKSFRNAHSKLAESGQNLFRMQLVDGFPGRITVAKSLLKRILNNFISNALKHTKNGEVTLSFETLTKTQLLDIND
jgi:signal transduction histidine kinase